jgi:hypothetical protein
VRDNQKNCIFKPALFIHFRAVANNANRREKMPLDLLPITGQTILNLRPGKGCSDRGSAKILFVFFLHFGERGSKLLHSGDKNNDCQNEGRFVMNRFILKTECRVIYILLTVLILCFNAAAESDIPFSKGERVYIPIYSHIYGGDREQKFLLTATLSIRNTDPQYPIILVRVDYYDSAGKMVTGYLNQPIQLNPMSSVRYIVKESDISGGSGANFIVEWKSETPVNMPITESIMIGTKMQQGISFTSRGQIIKEH